MIDAVLKQFSGVFPFISLVIGPAAGQQRNYERTSLTFKRSDITVSGISGKPCFSGQGAVHHMQKCIVIHACKAASARRRRLPFFFLIILKRMALRSCNF